MVLSELEALIKKGYVLHGSKHKFDIAKPHKKDLIPDGGGKLKAIYATDVPLIAMFNAILRGKQTPVKLGVKGWRFFKNGNIRFRLTPNYFKYNAFDKGYVYAFKKQNFTKDEKIPHEFYTIESQKPEYVFEVNPKDFLDNAKISLWRKDELRKGDMYSEEEIKLMWK